MSTTQFHHGFSFDPAYGMDLTQLLAIVPPEPPDDFAAFWQDRYTAALTLDARPQIVPTGVVMGNHAVHDLRYRSSGDVEIGGWLLVPRSGSPKRGVIIGHGYGGRTAPDEPIGLDESVVLFPCFRGMGRSPVVGISSDPNFHVLHDIQDRKRYVLGGCVDDLWLGVSALLSLFPEVSGKVACLGISFGGGIGVLASPWDCRISRLHVQVPTFGHQSLRLTLSCVGSGEAVRSYQQQHRFNVNETLAYYDAANAARFLRIPALVAAALFDPAVPPPGQFAIYNAIPQPLRCLLVLDAGHFDYPGDAEQQRVLNLAVTSFLMEDDHNAR
ncbi:acetylxylan esterase [Propionivibrio sp.]|uniref:acetylxylan esterase n=1 Tax=Propionivibrio sp. TaxID=2212460 RepID=UPI003BF3CEA7